MLDAHERQALYHLITKGRPCQDNGAPLGRTVWNTVCAALMSSDPNATTLASQGFLTQFVQVDRVPSERLNELGSKSFWIALCQREHLPMPETLLTCTNGTKVLHGVLNDDESYIFKPDASWGGRGVRIITGAEARQLPCSEDYSIQQRLSDCTTGGKARSFRVITLYNGSMFKMYSVQAQTTRLTSNFGVAKACAATACNIPVQGMEALQRLAVRLAHVHRQRLGDLFCVGWDCMIDCSDEGITVYVLEGNIFCSALLGDATLQDAAEFKTYALNYERQMTP